MLAQRISAVKRVLSKPTHRQSTRNVSTMKYVEAVEPLNPASLSAKTPLNVVPERVPTHLGALPSASNVEVLKVKGLTLVAINEPVPVTTMSLFIKAGSRYEEGASIGASHFLKRFAFRSTEKKYFYPLILDADVRGTEYGAVNTKEFVGYYMTGLRSEQANMAETLGSVFQPRLEEWEVEAVREEVRAEVAAQSTNGKQVLLDAVHREAFRDQGLANSTLTPAFQVDQMTPLALRHFVNTHYVPERFVIVGNGTSMEELKSHVDAFTPFDSLGMIQNAIGPGLEAYFPLLTPAGTVHEAKSVYTGGSEIRLPGAGATQIVVAAEGVGANAGIQSQLAAATLQTILGAGVANMRGIIPGFGKQSRLGKVVASSSDWLNAAESFSLSYSDAGLFGIYAQANPGNVGRVCDSIAQQFRSLEVVTEEEVARAKAQLKQSILSSVTGDRLTAAEFYSSQVAQTGSALTPSQYIAQIDQVSAASVVEVAKKVAASKLTVAALGDVKGLSRF